MSAGGHSDWEGSGIRKAGTRRKEGKRDNRASLSFEGRGASDGTAVGADRFYINDQFRTSRTNFSRKGPTPRPPCPSPSHSGLEAFEDFELDGSLPHSFGAGEEVDSWEDGSNASKPSKTVVLNVYDLNPEDAKKKHVTNVNDWALMLGTGAFHSGVQVHGKEWSFGSSADHVRAIQPCHPRRCCPAQYKFRMSVKVGTTNLSPKQVNGLIEEMARSDRYQGSAYNLLKNNCNDFSNDLCKRLTGGRGIPKWVNRGARALDKILDSAERVASHPVTKSVKQAFCYAGRGVSEGVTVGVSAVKKTMEASQEGLKDFLSQIERFQCLGGAGLLRTCYGEGDLQEPETAATTKDTTNPPPEQARRRTSKDERKKQRKLRSAANCGRESSPSAKRLSGGESTHAEQNISPAAEISAPSLTPTPVRGTSEFKGLGCRSKAETGNKRARESATQGASL